MHDSSNDTRVYLDYAATAPMRPEVWEAMAAELPHSYNPASTHAFGRDAHQCLEAARERIAGVLGCARGEIYFTGGGTQSNNLAILGFARAHAEGARVLLSSVEHKAGLEAARQAAREGAEVHFIPVGPGGTIDLEALSERLRDGGGPTLVSVMWANNEVGTIQPVEEIAALARESGALFHTDAVQAVGKVEVSLDRVPAELLTATAHKLGGPVGIGLLSCREGTRLEPLLYGGAQERKIWPGTQNPLAACGFATACVLAVEEREREAARWLELRDALADRIRETVPGVLFHAEEAPRRLPNLLSVGVPECDAGALLVSLDMEGIAVSGGSACGSGSAQGSEVLDAMGLGDTADDATIRFSFGRGTVPTDIERAGEALGRSVALARKGR